MNADAMGPMRPPEPVGTTDLPYTFGRPASTYLAPREIVRLTILRSKLRDRDSGLSRPPRSGPAASSRA